MQEQIKDDYYKRIERAVDFIEENLTKKLTVGIIAQTACFSKYHFIRVFKAVTGETVGSYLRRRRISRSSKDLINSSRSILSIALDYQFESQEAYSRSFKKVYHTSPGKYRKLNNDQIAYGRAKLRVERLNHLKSKLTMKPKIMEIERKNLVGMSAKTTISNNTIPQLWNDFMPRIKSIQNNKKTGYYEICPFDSAFKMEDFTGDMEFVKWAAVEVANLESPTDGLRSIIIEGGLYSVFEHKGSMSKIQLSFDHAYGTWLPNSNYELDKRASFERYGEQYYGPDNPDSIAEIWIPIKPIACQHKS